MNEVNYDNQLAHIVDRRQRQIYIRDMSFKDRASPGLRPNCVSVTAPDVGNGRLHPGTHLAVASLGRSQSNHRQYTLSPRHI